jgi:hypothetical protein
MDGRVSAKDWSEAVTAKGRVRFSETTARAYARCWRKFGNNRQEGWSFSDHLQHVWGHSKVEVVARRVDAEPIPNGGSTRIVLEGHTPDEVEDFVAAIGAVPEVPIGTFHGDYAPAGEPPTGISQQNPGLKSITLVFTTDEYHEWVKTIKDRMAAWGCKSGSVAALELLRRSAEPSPDEVEARYQFWLAIHGRDLDPEREALTRAAFSAGAQVPSIARPLTADARANLDVEAASN